jgi:hypothetical protein
MLEIALHYIDPGWSVRPPCKDKAPLARGGVHIATRDHTIIEYWCFNSKTDRIEPRLQ